MFSQSFLFLYFLLPFLFSTVFSPPPFFCFFFYFSYLISIHFYAFPHLFQFSLTSLFSSFLTLLFFKIILPPIFTPSFPPNLFMFSPTLSIIDSICFSSFPIYVFKLLFTSFFYSTPFFSSFFPLSLSLSLLPPIFSSLLSLSLFWPLFFVSPFFPPFFLSLVSCYCCLLLVIVIYMYYIYLYI